MKNKFTDYLSSQVVSQTTLLLKFNKIIEYLKQNPTINIYMSSAIWINGVTTYDINSITPKKQMYTGDMVVFNNGMFGMIESVGDSTFTVLSTIPLPKGKDGIDGNGILTIETEDSYVSGEYTITPIKVIYTDDNVDEFTIKVKNGEKGADGTDGTDGENGVGISSITTISHSTIGNETITILRINYTNGETEDIEVHAENGNTNKYIHVISLNFLKSSEGMNINCKTILINNDPTPITALSYYDEAYGNDMFIYGYGTQTKTDPATIHVTALSYQGEWSIQGLSENGETVRYLCSLITVNDTVKNL